MFLAASSVGLALTAFISARTEFCCDTSSSPRTPYFSLMIMIMHFSFFSFTRRLCRRPPLPRRSCSLVERERLDESFVLNPSGSHVCNKSASPLR